MSVYTNVSFDELSAWLLRYALGPLEGVTPIASGIENTNYFVTTTHERLVLTLYERLPAEDLPFYLNLMAHLAQHAVPAPAPVADRSGTYFSVLNGKPASRGSDTRQPDAGPLRVPANHVFVLSDNHQLDSLAAGPIPAAALRGRLGSLP